ncbi:MAG: signal peptidase II [Rhodovibrionaceae bacterium]
MNVTFALAALALLLDQLSKWVILLAVMTPPRSIEVTGFFNLVLTYNRGVSFGFLASNLWWKPYLLSGLALAVVAGLLVWLHLNDSRLRRIGIGLITGGALGNVIDRMLHPGVVDFLDFHVFGWHWPAFNLADSAIFLGVVLLLSDGLFADDQSVKTKASGRNEDHE